MKKKSSIFFKRKVRNRHKYLYFFYFKESKKSAHEPRILFFLGSKNLCRFFTVPPPRIYTVEKKHKFFIYNKSPYSF